MQLSAGCAEIILSLCNRICSTFPDSWLFASSLLVGVALCGSQRSPLVFLSFQGALSEKCKAKSLFCIVFARLHYLSVEVMFLSLQNSACVCFCFRKFFCALKETTEQQQQHFFNLTTVLFPLASCSFFYLTTLTPSTILPFLRRHGVGCDL